jgi:tRNA A-37 threonylcarbamoyl transferase component Bud32
MSEAAAIANASGAPSVGALADCVRRGLGLAASEPVNLTEVTELTNINYVYRVEIFGRSLYLKVVPARPKRFITNLPRERVFSEAEGLRRFRKFAGNRVIIPDVLFVDESEMALAMSDVSIGRQVLFSKILNSFELLTEQAEALGSALGAVHAGTRGTGSPRPAQEEIAVRQVIFEGLLSPGPRAVFPDMWPELKAEMENHTECLVHADLWSKNLLVGRGRRIAIVDFEGVFFGDPAFDLATLIAVALLAALENLKLIPQALTFISGLLGSWTLSCGSANWATEVAPRGFRATACFLAARSAGPFPYALSDDARQRVNRLATSLAASSLDLAGFREILLSQLESDLLLPAVPKAQP